MPGRFSDPLIVFLLHPIAAILSVVLLCAPSLINSCRLPFHPACIAVAISPWPYRRVHIAVFISRFTTCTSTPLLCTAPQAQRHTVYSRSTLRTHRRP
ncbi:uncharacterized protein BJ171DRAFT_500068, partial [Polychytrium aggregatum]